MKKIYIDYTQIGGNSFQLGLLNSKNLSTIFFMTILWTDNNNSQIIIPSDLILKEECYREISTIIDIIRVNDEIISKDNLSKVLNAIGYNKNPFSD